MEEQTSSKKVQFKRPNREPKNKLGWGKFSGGVTVNKASEILSTKYQINEGGDRGISATARRYTSHIQGMYQLRHANPQMVAIALYVIFELMNYKLDAGNTDEQLLDDLDKLDNILDKNMEDFMLNSSPIEEKRIKSTLEETEITTKSLKAAIVRYVFAIYQFVTGIEDSDMFVQNDTEDEYSENEEISEDLENLEEEIITPNKKIIINKKLESGEEVITPKKIEKKKKIVSPISKKIKEIKLQSKEKILPIPKKRGRKKKEVESSKEEEKIEKEVSPIDKKKKVESSEEIKTEKKVSPISKKKKESKVQNKKKIITIPKK